MLFDAAVMVTVSLDATVPAVAENVLERTPMPTVKLGGTIRLALLLERLTVTALVAVLVSVTVQMALCPLPSVVGLQLTSESCAAALALKRNVLDTPLADAVSVEVRSPVTGPTVAENDAALVSPTTLTLAGTATLALLDVSATRRPPLGAAPVSVTVQAADPGVLTPVGVQVSVSGVTCPVSATEAVLETPFQVAVTVADWLDVSVPALAVKFAETAVAPTVTVAGTLSPPTLLERVTVAMVPGAFVSVTVHAALWPLPKELGTQLRSDNWAATVTDRLNVRDTPLELAVSVAV